MKYSTEGIDTSKKGKTSKYITCGGQKLKINSLEIEKAGTGSKRVVFNMETEPIGGDFEGQDGAKGQIGRVRTFYMKTDDQVAEFLTNVGIIADKLGVREKIDSVKADTIEELVDAYSQIITGKYLHWIVTAEEYPKIADNSIGISLHFRRYGFVASLEEGAGHLKPFNRADQYDYKPLAQQQAEVASNL